MKDLTTRYAAVQFWAIETTAQRLEQVADNFWEMGDSQPHQEDRIVTYGLADSYRMAAKEVRRQIPSFLEMEARNLAAIKAWDKASAVPPLEQWEPMKSAPGGLDADSDSY